MSHVRHGIANYIHIQVRGGGGGGGGGGGPDTLDPPPPPPPPPPGSATGRLYCPAVPQGHSKMLQKVYVCVWGGGGGGGEQINKWAICMDVLS